MIPELVLKCQRAVVACVYAEVDAISFAFVGAHSGDIDASSKHKCPLLYGDAQRVGTEAVKRIPRNTVRRRARQTSPCRPSPIQAYCLSDQSPPR